MYQRLVNALVLYLELLTLIILIPLERMNIISCPLSTRESEVRRLNSRPHFIFTYIYLMPAKFIQTFKHVNVYQIKLHRS